MKKKIISVLLLVAVLGFGALKVVKAEKVVINSGGIYGTISTERIEASDDDQGFETVNIYITKSSSSYIYMTFTPTLNVDSIVLVTPASGFKLVSSSSGTNNSQTVLIESSSGKISSETLVLTLKIRQEEIGEDCEVAIEPLSVNCEVIDGTYYINSNGEKVTEEVYNQVCSNVTEPGEDVKTGIPIPYIAVIGGLIAIAGVYLYNRRQKKMFKI